MKKIVLPLLILAILLALPAAGETMKLPASLTEIGEEAFMNDASLTEVELPDELRVIGAGAFRNCPNLVSVRIPWQVEEIGEQAFDPSVVILGYPYGPAPDFASANGNAFYSYGANQVSWNDIYRDEGALILYVMSTSDPCFLRVDLLGSGQTEVLATASVPCGAGLDNQSVSVPFDSFPQSFYVRAVMETENGVGLCDPVIFEDFYDPAADFDELTPDDFAGQTVLNFGSEGFAVLLDSVRTVEGTVSGDVYTIQSDEEIYPGDALYLPALNDLVQAESVSSQGDGIYLVTRIIDAGLEPFFRFLNYEGKIDAIAGLGNTTYAKYVKDDPAHANVKLFNEKIGSLDYTGDINLNMSLDCKIRYAPSILRQNDPETRLIVTSSVDVAFALARKIENKKQEFTLFTTSIPTSVPGVLVDLNIAIPLELKAEVKGEASVGFTSRMGFTYDENNGCQTIMEKEDHWDAELEGEASIKAGLKGTVGLSFMRLIGVHVGAEACIELKAAETLWEHHSEEEDPHPEKRHACDLCLDLTADWYVELIGEVKILKENIAEANYKLLGDRFFTGYLSIRNDEYSIHGGEVTIGEGECPNYEYRVRLNVEDPDEPNAEKPASIYRLVNMVEHETLASGTAPIEAYLYPGEYTAQSTHLDHPETMTFRVEDEAVDLLMDFSLIPVDEYHFPDEGFREWVADTYDLDGDWMLNSWERCRVKEMVIQPQSDDPGWASHFPITCMSFEGLQYFTKLQILHIGMYRNAFIKNELGSWDNGDFFLATDFGFGYSFLDNTSLLSTHAGYSQLTDLDLTGNQNLTYIELYGLPRGRLDVSNLTSLTYLTCYRSHVSNVDLTGDTALQTLMINGMVDYHDWNESLTLLNLNGNQNLKSLQIAGCLSLTQMDLSQNTKLTSVGITHIPLARLNLSHCTQLEHISLGWCEGMVIDVSCFRYDPECHGLYRIDSYGNRQDLGLYLALKACIGQRFICQNGTAVWTNVYVPANEHFDAYWYEDLILN